MDDLDVIRLLAMDNIARGRIARAADGSEGKSRKISEKAAEAPLAVYPTLLQAFP